MKKSFVIGLISLACSATASFGQGVILLDNYNTGGPLVTYGSTGVPANGVSGAQGGVGTGLQAGWTMGFYYVIGSPTVGSDPSGNTADPATLGAGLTLATGTGSTAAFYTSTGTPGMALGTSVFTIPGTSAGGGDTITLMTVAFSGSSYAGATFRAHSGAFTLMTSANNSPTPHAVGSSMPAFAIAVPEPSICGLVATSGCAFLYFRRRK